MKVFSIELHDNERIILKIRQHWILHLWPSVKFVFWALIGIVGVYYARNYINDSLILWLLYLVWVLIFFIPWLHHFFHWYLNIYVVTNKRIINVTHSGIFNRQTTETSFHKIQDVTHRTLGFASILFNYGDVIIQTAGHATLIHFHVVPRPREIHKQIMDLLAHYHAHPAEHNNRPSFMHTFSNTDL